MRHRHTRFSALLLRLSVLVSVLCATAAVCAVVAAAAPVPEATVAPGPPPRTAAQNSGVALVLPLGAGMTLIGLGFALLALRSRRS